MHDGVRYGDKEADNGMVGPVTKKNATGLQEERAML